MPLVAARGYTAMVQLLHNLKYKSAGGRGWWVMLIGLLQTTYCGWQSSRSTWGRQGTKNFPPTVFQIAVLTFSQKTWKSEEGVTFASRELNGFLASKCLLAWETANTCHVLWTNSVAFSPQANYTDWATATCWRNLVPNFADRGVSRGQRGGSPTAVNLSFLDRSRYFLFQVAPHLS
jgi:hypothetical protein